MDCTTHHVRRKTGAFFIGKESNRERVLCLEIGFVQGFDQFESGEDTQRAVIAPSGGNRIDM